MKPILTTLALLIALPATAFAADPSGIWRTEANDKGQWLEVTLAPCAGDAGKICGIITKARNPDGTEGTSPNVGKTMIQGMVADGDNYWSDGTIRAPDDGETYSSKMELKGDTLTVKGCIAAGLLCRGQDWSRVQ